MLFPLVLATWYLLRQFFVRHRTSTAARFQRSLVGAVAFSCTTVPGVAIAVERVCTQYVPVDVMSIHCCTMTWSASSVRATARSNHFLRHRHASLAPWWSARSSGRLRPAGDRRRADGRRAGKQHDRQRLAVEGESLLRAHLNVRQRIRRVRNPDLRHTALGVDTPHEGPRETGAAHGQCLGRAAGLSDAAKATSSRGPVVLKAAVVRVPDRFDTMTLL